MKTLLIIAPYVLSVASLIVSMIPIIDFFKKTKYAKGGIIDERFKND